MLTDDIGHPKLKEHFIKVNTLMDPRQPWYNRGMSEPRGGPIGFFIRRPWLCLATVGSVVTLSSVVDLAVVIFADTGSRFYRPGNNPSLPGWLPWSSWIALRPWSVWIMLAGLFGFAIGATLLIATVYLRGQRTKTRLLGSVLIAYGVLQSVVSLCLQVWGGLLLGLLFLGIGAVLARRSAVHPPAPAGDPAS